MIAKKSVVNIKPNKQTIVIVWTVICLCIGCGGVVAQDNSPLNKITLQQTGDAWDIKLADDPKTRQVGLMFVREMEPYNGMLFRFEQARVISMWMKNTYIPLDMVFVDGRGVIRAIHQNAVPHSLDSISSKVPVKFVLEINAGEAEEAGLEVGMQMKHPWFSP